MNKVKQILKEYSIYIIIIISIVLVRHFLFTTVKVNGDSMNNTLKNNDMMILDKVNYIFNDIERFDIVVIKKDNDYLIKRVIGLPGERIEYIDNKLYIDGKYIEEDFLESGTHDFKDVVVDDEYYVMGDNRYNSIDSRVIGSISKKEIQGKTNLIIYPFNKFGKVE